MHEVNLTFDVHCQRPGWALIDRTRFFPEPDNHRYHDVRYRVYINDNLITERSWIWSNKIFLKENIWIYGNNNSEYVLQLEPVLNYPNQAKFSIDNFSIINLPADNIKINDLQINFTLR